MDAIAISGLLATTVPARFARLISARNKQISAPGTFETCQPILKMSANRAIAEVIGARSERRDRPISDIDQIFENLVLEVLFDPLPGRGSAVTMPPIERGEYETTRISRYGAHAVAIASHPHTRAPATNCR